MKKTNRKAPVVAFHRQLGAENPHFPLLSRFSSWIVVSGGSRVFLGLGFLSSVEITLSQTRKRLPNWKVLPIGKPGLGLFEEHGRSIHENGKISHGRNGSRNCTRLPESLHMLDNPKPLRQDLKSLLLVTRPHRAECEHCEQKNNQQEDPAFGWTKLQVRSSDEPPLAPQTPNLQLKYSTMAPILLLAG
ncbi:hypothetical protein AAMO2058_000644100 [Amorphochlora amoebiformis]